MVGTNKAVEEVVALAEAGELPPHLQDLVKVANLRRGENRTVRRHTLYAWRRAFREGGLIALAPRDTTRKELVPPWGRALLAAYRRPQKPALTDAVREINAAGHNVSYQTARRFLATVGKVERERGRRSGKELKALKSYVHRDTSNLSPNDVWMGDGHTFDAEVAHPTSGQPFRPEVTTWLDVATRMPMGWSCGVAESALEVLDALRHGIERMGVPAILYLDRGKGYKNQLLTGEGVGIVSRLGITVTYSLPYNSQARGLIERFHGSTYVPAATRLPTFIGKDMDPDAKRAVFKETRKAVSEGRPSKFLLPWEDFKALIDDTLDAYSKKPHRGLPRFRDPVTGNLRHYSPLEMLRAAVEKGWKPTRPVGLVDVYHPQVLCKVKRCEIKVFGNHYYAPELEDRNGESLCVAYDVHDPTRVWVRDADQNLLCVANLDETRIDYVPKSFVERAREKREAGRLKRLERKTERIRGEREDNQPRIIQPLTPEQDAKVDDLLRRTEEQERQREKKEREDFERSWAKFEAAERERLERERQREKQEREDFERSWAKFEAAERERLERERQREEEERRKYERALAMIKVEEREREEFVPILPRERYEWARAKRGRGEILTEEENAWIEDHEHYVLTGERRAR